MLTSDLPTVNVLEITLYLYVLFLVSLNIETLYLPVLNTPPCILKTKSPVLLTFILPDVLFVSLIVIFIFVILKLIPASNFPFTEIFSPYNALLDSFTVR